MEENAIVVKDLKKSFKLPHENTSGLKQVILNIGRKDRNKGFEVQDVLKGISFEVKKGDFFGIVGRNGSGKSTLLKLLAGIYTPDSGAVETNGSIVPFIELGVGFNPELTGRENIFLNGALLGFSRKEMLEMYDDIVDFAELDRFMDQKLKNYSSGMQVRLAFSIAIKAQGDILILDEVLAVGDEAFQRKCSDYFDNIRKDKSKTVILVTHSMESVRKYCNKALMIRDGEVVIVGEPEDVSNEYSMENLGGPSVAKKEKKKEKSVVSSFNVELSSSKKINENETVAVKYVIQSSKDVDLRIDMDLQDVDKNTFLFSGGSKLRTYRKGQKIESTVRFSIKDLNDASIRVNSSVKDAEGNLVAFSWNEDAPTFMLRRTDYPGGKSRNFAVLFDRGKWF